VGNGESSCDPPCEAPFECDEQTGECVCPEGECCALVDCWCTAGERHCDGDNLTGCEARDVQGENGLCGSVCEYPVIRACTQGCVEDEYGLARCMEDPEECDVMPTEKFDVTVSVPGGGLFSCQTASIDVPIEFEATGTAAYSAQEPESFTVQTREFDVFVTTNLPWYVRNCVWDGRQVRIKGTWRIDPAVPTYCIRSLTVHSGGQLLLFAQDGTMQLPQGLPFTVSLDDLGCPLPPDPSCQTPATYAMDFAFENGPAARVHQGEQAELTYMGEPYEVYNMRSYVTAACDDYWNYAFYVTQLCGDAEL
jgi:hypothetical protein